MVIRELPCTHAHIHALAMFCNWWHNDYTWLSCAIAIYLVTFMIWLLGGLWLEYLSYNIIAMVNLCCISI